MLSKNDIQVLRGMFEENNHILKREIRDEIHSVVHAAVSGSESSLRKELYQIRDEIIDVINDEILPQIEEHRIDIARLKVVTGIA